MRYRRLLSVGGSAAVALALAGCVQLPIWNPPHLEARAGLFDLSKWDFARGGPLKLTGAWEFTWGRLVPPHSKEPLDRIVPVPAQWVSYQTEGGALPVVGVATYRLRLRVPTSARGRLALRIPSSDSAFRLFVNGREAMTNGSVEPDPARSVPIRYTPLIVHLDVPGTQIELLVHVANSQYPRPGLRDPITIGLREDILKLTERKLAFEIFLFGAIFLIALYHFGLFLLRRSDRVALFFAALSLAVSVRILATGESYAFEMIPGLTWKISTFFEYFSYYSATPLFMLFFRTLYPRETLRYVNYAIYAIGALGCAYVIVTPLYYYSQTVLAYHLFTVASSIYILVCAMLAVVRRREAARTFLVGLVILLASLIHDILVVERVLDSILVAPFGLFAFFFSHAFLLSKLFARAFNTAESLSRELELRVEERTRELAEAMHQSDALLRNILPGRVAQELKETGAVRPLHYAEVTVLFVDFVGFTQLTEQLSTEELVRELDACFSGFDRIVEEHGLEKLKTMGDAYMCAGGLPEPGGSHSVRACLAALEMQSYLRVRAAERGRSPWVVRVGIHTGPVTAGVIGKKKFAYDIWGDTVNTAARMESAGEPGRTNVSEATRNAVIDFFECTFRGRIQAKNKGELAMYFLDGIREGLHERGVPNERFRALMQSRFVERAAG